MKIEFIKKEWKELVDCVDFTTNSLRMTHKVYLTKNDDSYRYLNFLVDLRNKIIQKLNKESEK